MSADVIYLGMERGRLAVPQKMSAGERDNNDQIAEAYRRLAYSLAAWPGTAKTGGQKNVYNVVFMWIMHFCNSLLLNLWLHRTNHNRPHSSIARGTT